MRFDDYAYDVYCYDFINTLLPGFNIRHDDIRRSRLVFILQRLDRKKKCKQHFFLMNGASPLYWLMKINRTRSYKTISVKVEGS